MDWAMTLFAVVCVGISLRWALREAGRRKYR